MPGVSVSVAVIACVSEGAYEVALLDGWRPPPPGQTRQRADLHAKLHAYAHVRFIRGSVRYRPAWCNVKESTAEGGRLPLGRLLRKFLRNLRVQDESTKFREICGFRVRKFGISHVRRGRAAHLRACFALDSTLSSPPGEPNSSLLSLLSPFECPCLV